MPKALRQTAANALTSLSPQTWDGALANFSSLLRVNFQKSLSGFKAHKLAEVLAVSDPEAMYMGLVSHWKDPEALVIGGFEPPTNLTDRQRWAKVPSFTESMMYLDTVTYLPDDMTSS